MKTLGTRYDPELQMFTDEPREVDLSRLRFLRWLGERGRLEHEIAGGPAGVFSLMVAIDRPDGSG